MGQENSHEQIDPSTPPRTLSARSLEAVAEYIKDGRPKRIVVMTGAGVSTSAGIPDFRSPDTGLYANLARLDLPYAEAVFDISYFRQNPDPFYVLAKELYPGKFYPTIAHSFVALLNEKSMLQMLFTQNIDCLERKAGVPGDKIVEAHGSFATQRCIDCKTEYPDNLMIQAVEGGEVPHCTVPQCNGLVKPDIVFFGEALPEAFFQNRHVPAMADLVIVMGTSLSVQPFASLPQFASEAIPRVLINKEIVGDFGSRPDDVVVLGDCDEGVKKLADALGWRDELESMWLEVGGKVKEKEAARLREQRQAMSQDEILEAEIEKLTGEVDAALRMSKDHEERVITQLEKSSSSDISTSAAPASLDDIPSGTIMTKEESKDHLSSGQSTASSEVPTKSEGGWREPPSTPAVGENTPPAAEKVNKELPSASPQVDSKAIIDVTLPHQRPNTLVPESESDQNKKPSRI
ncbi:NAD-dependent deacetylase sirtuin-2 [Hyaloscypha bicolor E]|uniref:NAD-dependent deacetylase sirtuin-2 n=1 Tax=Hyaloscypha bicolor E TaxID=1095630 RepID=A0A2J6T3V8_9HELO|nr:NAD-dependent deacetylase sirtuin-2 [Hyaloscypha bicolor E]PMD57689.1 NAD-dependent deacetylase sirtuin-2 [Hyaloscypha bicolor E]